MNHKILNWAIYVHSADVVAVFPTNQSAAFACRNGAMLYVVCVPFPCSSRGVGDFVCIGAGYLGFNNSFKTNNMYIS